MARRVLEAELKDTMGVVQKPFQGGKTLTVLKEYKVHQSFQGVFSMQFNFDGSVLAVGYGSGGIQLFDTRSREMTRELRVSRHGGGSIMCLKWHPKVPDILYAADTEGKIYIYDTEKEPKEELQETITEQGNEINTLDFCVDGYNFATGGRDLNVRVYETNKNRLVRTFEGYNEKTALTGQNKVSNTMRVFCINFHPNNEHVFISGGWDNHIKVWDIRNNEGVTRKIAGPHICGDALDMKGNTILAGQWTGLHELQEYDYTSGKCTREIKYPSKNGAFLYAAQYVNSDLVIAGGSGTNKAEIIDVNTNENTGTHVLEGPVHCVDSANDGRVLAVGGKASTFAMLTLEE